MPIHTADNYDVIVVGAGIAGCNAAWALQQKEQRVLLLDRSAVPASGGSGAAGAFVAPKIGKGGPLQKLTNTAYAYAKDFYRDHFPEYFSKSGLVRLPRDPGDRQKFEHYAAYNGDDCVQVGRAFFARHGIQNETIGFWFEEAGVCDAPAMCRAIGEQVGLRQFNVTALEPAKQGWVLHSADTSLSARRVVLATGHQNDLLDMRYMGVKGLWGSRGDYVGDVDLHISLHKNISISRTINGIIKLGATHVKAENPCMACDGRPLANLEAQAADIMGTHDWRLQETFCGMRAGSRDYVPLVGRVVDVPRMLAHHPNILRGAKPPLQHLEGLYVLNGMGGRGFVWAPLMAQWLAACIVDGVAVPASVHPDRLLLKWARKLLMTGK